MNVINSLMNVCSVYWRVTQGLLQVASHLWGAPSPLIEMQISKTKGPSAEEGQSASAL